MTDYSNIMAALGKNNQLSVQEQNANFDAYRKLTDNGVSIPKLLEKIDSMEKRMSEIEKPKENPLDAELFAVMESAVKDDRAVIDAKHKLQSEKTRVISELCVKDERYRGALDEYRRAVNQAYVQYKEIKTSD
ncbi:MAG: hypothetical protein IJV02_06695 [Candidatus Methanomethylophilaceae archaeon]|nr:hypothetical protein [Candidatus Methanomethylophilaceae archaeon]